MRATLRGCFLNIFNNILFIYLIDKIFSTRIDFYKKETKIGGIISVTSVLSMTLNY